MGLSLTLPTFIFIFSLPLAAFGIGFVFWGIQKFNSARESGIDDISHDILYRGSVAKRHQIYSALNALTFKDKRGFDSPFVLCGKLCTAVAYDVGVIFSEASVFIVILCGIGGVNELAEVVAALVHYQSVSTVEFTREHLTKHLDGSAAWRFGNPAA